MMEKLQVQNTRIKILKKIILFLVLSSQFLVLCSCSPQKETVYRKTKIYMDTLVTMNVVSDSSERADRAMDRAFDEIGRLDKLLSIFSYSSEISMINRNAGIKEVEVSPEILEVVGMAIDASEKTGGAFDVTIGPEISLWDFHLQKKPEDKAIRKRLSLVNYRLISVDRDRSTVYLRGKGMAMDLGGIAKGYAADKAVTVLKKQGIKSGLVSVAGDIKAFGLKPDGKPWRVGIKNPRPKNADGEIMATFELFEGAISTAGDYERYFVVDGRRYHHILDPKTGYPASDCRSVTVIAKEGFQTDSFSTGVFVLGPEKGLEFLKQMGFDGIVVDRDGNIKTTPGLGGRIEFKRNG